MKKQRIKMTPMMTIISISSFKIKTSVARSLLSTSGIILIPLLVQCQSIPTSMTIPSSSSFIATCGNWNDECPINAPLSYCLKDPCAADPNVCPQGQGLTCRANYCGGCHAVCCVTETTHCTLDTMLCPDGVTYVTRNHQDGCNFFPCHDSDEADANNEAAGSGEEFKDKQYADHEDDYYPYDSNEDKEVVAAACSYDVELCPDGITTVGRDPYNNCLFYPCTKGDSGSSASEDLVDEEEEKECISDLMLCSDGETYVSRDPNNCCLFQPCPNLSIIGGLKHWVTDRWQCFFDD